MMKTNIENKENGKKNKGLTLEEFRVLWDERRDFNSKTWKYNIISLGHGNFIRADQYILISEDEVALYYFGFKIAELELRKIKYIY